LLLIPFITLVWNLDVGVLILLLFPFKFSLGSRSSFRSLCCQLFSSSGLLSESFDPLHHLQDQSSVLSQRHCSPYLVVFFLPPTHFLLGAGVRNRVSILLVRSLCILSSIISTGAFLFKLFVGSPFQVAFVFSILPPLFFLESEPLFEHQFHSCRAYSLFPQSLQPMNSHLVHHCSSCFLSGGFNSSFRVDPIPFLSSNVYPCSFAYCQFILLECSRHLRRFVFQSRLVHSISRLSPHLRLRIIPVHHFSFNNPFQRCFLFSGPITHRYFPKILPNSSNSYGGHHFKRHLLSQPLDPVLQFFQCSDQVFSSLLVISSFSYI